MVQVEKAWRISVISSLVDTKYFSRFSRHWPSPKSAIPSLTLLVVYPHRHPAIWRHNHQCKALPPESLSPHILGSVGSAVFNCVKRPLRPLADCHRRGFDFRLFFHSRLSVRLHRFWALLSHPMPCGSAYRHCDPLPSSSNDFRPSTTVATQDYLVLHILSGRIVSDSTVDTRRTQILTNISVCITGIIRVALTYAPHSGCMFLFLPPWSLQLKFWTVVVIKCLMWSNIQLGTAITCACILTYRPLLTKCVIFYGVLVHHNNKPQHGKPEEEGSWSSHKNLRSQTHRPES